jgi:SWIM zinc finger
MTARMVEKVEFKAGSLSAQVTSENLFRGRDEPYICRLLPWGEITCSCENFQAVGGYCKHLRAALLQVSNFFHCD